MVNGHVYYVYISMDGFGDFQGWGAFSIPGLVSGNSWTLAGASGAISSQRMDILQRITYTGATGTVNANFWHTGRVSAPIPGAAAPAADAQLVRYNLIDLTAAYGAGNEPSLAEVHARWGGNWDGGTSSDVSGSKKVTTGSTETDKKGYVVEYAVNDNGFTRDSQSAEDTDVVGNVARTPIEISIDAESKVYDGIEVIAAVAVQSDVESTLTAAQINAIKNLLNVTYNKVNVTTAVGASGGVVNTNAYTATVHPIDDAALYTLEQEYVVTYVNDGKTDFRITPRPLHLSSYDNDRVYDGTTTATIADIVIAPFDATAKSGIVAGDTVGLSSLSVLGAYASSDQTNGQQIKITRVGELSLTNNQLGNYYIATEDYTGAITPRPVHLHSLYLVTDGAGVTTAHNTKQYDGTDAANVSDIIIENVIAGDDIELDKATFVGTYDTNQAGETLDTNGNALPDRLLKLEESIITRTEDIALTNNGRGNYYIESEDYSGAIYRRTISAFVSNYSYLYGEVDTLDLKTATTYSATEGGTSSDLEISAFVANDTLTPDISKSWFVAESVDENSFVGDYEIQYVGLTEANYPVLSNYIVWQKDGALTITPREIVIRVGDTEKMTGTENPLFNSTFYLTEADGSLTELGSDDTTAYADMLLCNSDTVLDTVLALNNGATTTLTITDGLSNIPYQTRCNVDSAALYDLPAGDYSTHFCDFCEDYHGFQMGTDHWPLGGYLVYINEDALAADTLTIAEVANANGEQVQNYVLVYEPGKLVVHPELRFQLKATVPLYVCMYGYRGDGTVVTPDNYGITNYSNGDIEIADLEVSNDGWVISSDSRNLAAGEMFIHLHDTTLVEGHNTPKDINNWIVAKDDSADASGVRLELPMQAQIAGGNVNDEGERYVTRITYTVQEHRTSLLG